MADAMKLLPCPFCGEEPRMRLGSNAYGHCATKGCHSHRAQIVPLDDAQQVEAWNRRASPPAREEASADGVGERLLREAAEKFRYYEASHRAKKTDEATAKAEVNSEIAGRIEAHLRNRTSEPEAREGEETK